MTKLTPTFFGLFCSLSFVVAQTPEKKEEKPHPAVLAIVIWAKTYQEGAVKPEQEIFQAKDFQALALLAEEGYDFRRELSKTIQTDKVKLSFQAKEDHPTSGKIISDGNLKLPMIQKDDRWYCDLAATLKEKVESARSDTAKQDLRSLMANLEQYRIIGGHYPSEEQALKALFQRPTTAPRPRRWIQTIAKVEAFNDPWGNAYRYKLIEGKPVIISLGPDGEVSEDDISSN